MDYPFVKTDDAETAQKLLDIGLELIDHTGGVYTFVNVPEHYQMFEGYENLTYSNILTI